MSLEKSLANFNKATKSFLSNQYTSYGLKAILICYAGMSGPQLLNENIVIFDNVLLRLVLAGVIVWLSFSDPTLSLLLAIALVLSIQELNKYKTNSLANIDSFYGGVTDDNSQQDQQVQQVQQDQQPNVLTSGGVCPNSGTYFTNENQLNDSQTNDISGSNEMSQVQTWQNQLGPQGLNQPYGYSGPNQNNASLKPSVGQFASEF